MLTSEERELISSRRVGWVASMVAVIGLAAVASPASGAFTSPVDLASNAANPQVATDPDGDSAFTWEFLSNRVQARTLSATGTLGPVLELGSASGTSDFTPRVAIDNQGDSVFAWTRSAPLEGVLARRLSAGGTLGNIIGVSPAGDIASAPEIATDVNGDTVFTWVNFESGVFNRVQARTMSSRGVLGTIRNVSPLSSNASAPQVATDAGGDSVLTWVRDSPEGEDDRVQARRLTVNGSLGPIVDLSTVGRRASAPQVATDADGDTTFTWLGFDGIRDRVEARRLSAGGALGATSLISPPSPSAIEPQVATDAAGDSVFAWERFDAAADRVQARTMTAAGALGATQSISPVNSEAFAQRVASAAGGFSVFTWLRFDGVADRVQARTMTAAGAFGATTADLSAAGVDAETPQIAVAATSNDAVATWERAGVVQTATGP